MHVLWGYVLPQAVLALAVKGGWRHSSRRWTKLSAAKTWSANALAMTRPKVACYHQSERANEGGDSGREVENAVWTPPVARDRRRPRWERCTSTTAHPHTTAPKRT